MWNWIEDYWPAVLVVLIVVALAALLGWAIITDSRNEQAEYNRLMTQCLNDGHKEYECVGILRKDHDTQVIPVIVPINTR